jgi:ATP-dependent Clp protease ATP-binding subunit ClpB
MGNPMNPELYTEKAFENIAKLTEYSDLYSTQKLEAPMLLKSLLDDGQGGLAQRILVKSSVDVGRVQSNLEKHLNSQPKVSDVSSKHLGATMVECLTKSNVEKLEYGDAYISVEHLLLGLVQTDGYTKTVFTDSGVQNLTALVKQIKDAIKSIRGSSKVTSRNAEGTYESLSKYCRDLTAAAAEGKLDPVIGRDEEIRRTIQILSRRTKNNPILLGEPGVGKTAIAEVCFNAT